MMNNLISRKNEKRIFLSPPHLGELEIEFVKEAFKDNYIAPTGPQIDAFEKEISELTGDRIALGVTSGTAAIHLALLALGIGNGDEVFASTLTFVGSVAPIVYQGGRPVFIDSEKNSWNMDLDIVEEEFQKRAENGNLPKAVISTELYGNCLDYERITAICKRWGIPLIIDSAEALGSKYMGKNAGNAGDFSVFSFNGNKIATTSGGGMLLSDDREKISKARFLSQQAREACTHYEHKEIGYNYRMSNILAAIGRGQLRVLEQRVNQKRFIFNYYKEKLGNEPGIQFIPEPNQCRSNRWLTVITIDPEFFGADSKNVRLRLEACNIESRPVWKPMHMQPVFKEEQCVGGKVSENFFDKGLCLPSGTALTTEEIDMIVDIILSSRC